MHIPLSFNLIKWVAFPTELTHILKGELRKKGITEAVRPCNDAFQKGAGTWLQCADTSQGVAVRPGQLGSVRSLTCACTLMYSSGTLFCNASFKEQSIFNCVLKGRWKQAAERLTFSSETVHKLSSLCIWKMSSFVKNMFPNFPSSDST